MARHNFWSFSSSRSAFITVYKTIFREKKKKKAAGNKSPERLRITERQINTCDPPPSFSSPFTNLYANGPAGRPRGPNLEKCTSQMCWCQSRDLSSRYHVIIISHTAGEYFGRGWRCTFPLSGQLFPSSQQPFIQDGGTLPSLRRRADLFIFPSAPPLSPPRRLVSSAPSLALISPLLRSRCGADGSLSDSVKLHSTFPHLC